MVPGVGLRVRCAVAAVRRLGGGVGGGGGGGGVRAAAETPLRRLLEEGSAFGEGARATPDALHWATQPYAARPGEGEGHGRETEDPRSATVLLFPGQGAHRAGMGRALADVPAARELYEFASSVVGWDVWRVCCEGSDSEVEARAQTCVFVTSLASLERAREERPAALQRVRAVAGFSLGEVAALSYAGALSLDAALRLVELRDAAMQACARLRPQGMLTLWLAPDARLSSALRAARDACAAPDAVCQVANHLYPGCKVVAGDEAALAWLESHGREWGVRRAARVRATGACHTGLMAQAAEAVREALRALEVRAPRTRVVSGVDARAYRSAEAVRRGISRAVTAPVLWEQTLHALYARPRGARFPLTLALGPGAALRATLRQVNARAWDSSLQILA